MSLYTFVVNIKKNKLSQPALSCNSEYYHILQRMLQKLIHKKKQPGQVALKDLFVMEIVIN
jgi:hypothetical protein